MKQLPIEISEFSNIIKRNYIYSDRTEILHKIVTENISCFLSRPSGFGKTVLVSTLESILMGDRELFEGLFIDFLDYNWKPTPVIRIDFNDFTFTDVRRIKAFLSHEFEIIAENNEVKIEGMSFSKKIFLVNR